MKTGIKVADAMTNKPVSISSDCSVTECAKLMRKYKVGSLLVKDENQVLGILTEKDFVEKILAKGKNPNDMIAADIMEKNLITIEPGRDIYEAMMEMRNSDIRRLPVEENGKIIGFLTMKDILKIEPQLFDLLVEKIELREEMLKPTKSEHREEGVCESCGNFTYDLQEDAGVKLCFDCRAN
ncbi:CBS domain-containing protein [archaeon]|nr:CBS domain-containing protein [archaeon]MBL7057457.1 CBS domain-containing protein [Candidatus Woesearchaeota archaeon]